MQLLVTGGLGFIGSNLVRYLLETHPSWSVVNLDAITYAGHPENLADLENEPRYRFVRGSINDASLVDEIVSGKSFGKIDGMINLAAETHVDRSIANAELFVRTNVLGTQVLLEAALKHGRSAQRTTKQANDYAIRFLQVSTDEVYGSLGDRGYFTEESSLKPNSPYSASKASADLLCRAYRETFGLTVLVTRCSNNYGPYQHPEKLIPLFITNALRNEPVPVYGNGLNIRDWLHVQDHCRAIDTVFLHGLAGEIYNIGGSNERQNIEITKLILAALDKSETLIKYVEDRPGHDRRYAIDSTKITGQLGWRPQYTFEEGIYETIKWYQSNQTWLKAVTEKSPTASPVSKPGW